MKFPGLYIKEGRFEFTAALDGEYTFETNDNQRLLRNLESPKILKIDDYKARIEFMPISDEVIAPVEITGLKSFTDFTESSIKYFAGKAKYTISFKVSDAFIQSQRFNNS